jgi:hypothetical protein
MDMAEKPNVQRNNFGYTSPETGRFEYFEPHLNRLGVVQLAEYFGKESLDSLSNMFRKFMPGVPKAKRPKHIVDFFVKYSEENPERWNPEIVKIYKTLLKKGKTDKRPYDTFRGKQKARRDALTKTPEEKLLNSLE